MIRHIIIMKFQSYQIRGDGVGTKSAVPTINLSIPRDFALDPGVYAVYVSLEHVPSHYYKGALHFGPRPTFGKTEMSLEVYILETFEQVFRELLKDVSVNVIGYVRPIVHFRDPTELKKQIAKDISKVNELLLHARD